MATAGDRYTVLTGNIWSYAHRGDLTGIRAALARGVDVNIVNTVGWTGCHAAAAGGQTRALRLLSRAGADVDGIRDNGGNLPVHQAAQNGHLKALQVLQELGADVSRVRLSHAKGKAVRDFISKSHRKKNLGKNNSKERNRDDKINDDNLEEEEHGVGAAVGYGRKQSKSTAFWGPRKTPSSGKIKKKILKERRQMKKKKAVESSHLTVEESSCDTELTDHHQMTEQKPESGYLATVQKVKRDVKQKRRSRRRRQQPKCDSSTTSDSQSTCSSDRKQREEDVLIGRKEYDYNDHDSCSSCDNSDNHEESSTSNDGRGRFAALTLHDDSDSSSDEKL